ncbi:hypothetical protein EON65_12700 [archaeon]|nr:MAG: hypothetical protein EON65_12700 [archaeon]
MLFRFFTEGRVPSQQTFAYCMDDEYIGALTGFAQELSRYTTNRACENDILSIEISRRLVTQLNEALLSLDFRNGPLRRKYDSVKYAVKAIEGIAFEFSLSSDSTRTTVLFSESTLTDSKAGVESPSKRARMEINETSLDSYIDMADIKIIQQRMEAFDLCREQVIKDSRDVQKLSKQAIFAIQRLNLAEAEKKLGQAKESGRTLLKRIESYPTLRQGALSNALEEWAEAMLLFHWVSSKTIISRGALEIASIAEYIGGLSDFTGEIGRIAVLRAAHRDLCMVQEILQADMVVQNFIAKANVSANRYAKKLEAVQVNLKKVEDIVYELVLLQRSNRVSRVKADVSMPADKEDAKEE